jgi:Family of unknown function (DUF6516)
MIEEYLRQIDELLSIRPAVCDVEIVRRSVRDTDFEKVLNYRYRITLVDGSFVEMTERVLEVHGRLEVTKYRHHWQDGHGVLIKRWDNAPHHPAVQTFPHHLHDRGEDRVVSHRAITGLEALQYILDEVEERASSGGEEDSLGS